MTASPPRSARRRVSRPADRNGARRGRQGQPPSGRRPVRAAALRIFPEPLRDAAHVEHRTGRAIAITADSFVVNPLRFPADPSANSRSTARVNDLAVSGARAASAGGHALFSKPACRPRRSKPKCAPWPMRRARPASASSAATPKSSSTAKPTACTSPPPASARPIPGVDDRSARRSGPAIRFCSPARSAITASPFCWPAANWISKPTSFRHALRACRSWKRWRASRRPAFAGCAIPRAAASPRR